MANKSVNGLMFQLVHYINDKTTKWLNNAKKTIKDNGIECITFNKNKNIVIEYANATAKYSKEDNAKLDELKATFVNLNDGKLVKKVVVKQYDEIITDLGDTALDNLIDTVVQQAESKALAKSASKTKLH